MTTTAAPAAAVASPAPTSESDASSGGFKSLFKRSSRPNSSAASSNLKFVHQDPGVTKKRSRISRMLKPDGAESGQDGKEEPLTPTQRRRQQVYQAQKRHRNRHAEYVRSLEAEVARLQHLDAMVNSEKNALAHQNAAIKEYLAKQSIDTRLDAMGLDSTPAPDNLSRLGGAAIDLRMDPDIGKERWFLDVPELTWSSSEVSSVDSPPKPLPRTPVAGDSWAALDFIMALEWPCRLHVHHPGISPNVTVPEIDPVIKNHGHALTATQAVFQSAQAQPAKRAEPNAFLDYNMTGGLQQNDSDKWILPHSEIDKLVELSETLHIDEDFITPAQAYAAVREAVPNDNYLRPTLAALKLSLGSHADCHAFGTSVDAGLFWQHLNDTLQTLQSTRPDLG